MKGRHTKTYTVEGSTRSEIEDILPQLLKTQTNRVVPEHSEGRTFTLVPFHVLQFIYVTYYCREGLWFESEVGYRSWKRFFKFLDKSGTFPFTTDKKVT